MKRLSSLLFLVAFAACGNEQAALIDAAALEGEWTLLFEEAEAGCEPETGGAFELTLHVDHTLTDILSDDVYVSGRWYAPTNQDEWSVIDGIFDRRRGTFEMTLWGAQRFEGAPRILITGDLDDHLGITGQWWEVDGQLLYERGCSGTLEGQRIS